MKGSVFFILLILSMFKTGYPQWSGSIGPSGPVAVSSLFQYDSTLFAITSCGIHSTEGLQDHWKLNSALPVDSYDIIGDSMFISVPYMFRPWSDYGIKRLDLSDPDAPAVDLNLQEAKAMAHSGSVLFAGSLSLGFLVSADYGVTWTPRNQGLYHNQLNQYSVHAIEVSDMYIYAGTDMGVFRNTLSFDGWVLINAANLTSRKAIIKEINGCLYLAIGNELFNSYDHGTVWNPVYTTPSAITSFTGSSMEFYVSTASNGIHCTLNGGLVWEELNTGLTDLHVNTITFFGPVLVCGTQSAGVFSYQGNQWINNSNGIVCSSIRSIAATSQGLVTNDDDKVYYKVNGTHWSNISPNVVKDNFKSIVTCGDSIYLSVHHDTLAIPSDLSFIIYSPDNGVTWLDLIHPVPFVQDDGYSLYSSNGKLYAFEDEYMYVTEKAGLTWTNMSLGSAYQYHYFSGLIVYNNTPFATIDSGESGMLKFDDNDGWILVNSGLPAGSIISNLTSCDGAMFVMTDVGGVYASTDNGNQWYRADNGTGVDFHQIFDYTWTGSTLIAATEQGVYVTSDYGKSWLPVNQGLKNTFTTSVEILNDTLYAGTDGNGIWTMPLSMIPLGIPSQKEIKGNILISPNPANDQINLTGLNTTNPGYQVYDMTGKCVMKGSISGEPSVKTSSLESGAYLIVIENADQSVNQCKFIISR